MENALRPVSTTAKTEKYKWRKKLFLPMPCKFPITLSPLSPHLSSFLYWPFWQLIPLTRSYILNLFCKYLLVIWCLENCLFKSLPRFLIFLLLLVLSDLPFHLDPPLFCLSLANKQGLILTLPLFNCPVFSCRCSVQLPLLPSFAA